VVDGESKVFGTPNLAFALQYTGRRWTDNDMESGRVNGQLYMLEKRPGIFARTFRKRHGYLYVLDPTTFHSDSRLGDGETEFVSDVPVKILETVCIRDAEAALLKAGIEVIRYEDMNIIEFVKHEADMEIRGTVFNADHLQVLIELDKRLIRVRADSIDYESIYRYLYGPSARVMEFRAIGVTKCEPRYSALWAPRKKPVRKPRMRYSVFP
jgi:hypothetical protein